MTRNPVKEPEPAPGGHRPGLRTCLAAALLVAGLPVLAEGGPDLAFHLWAGPEGVRLRDDSPYADGAGLAGLGKDAGRIEAVLRLRAHGLTVEGSLRAESVVEGPARADALFTELYQELDLAGQHLTLGKKVTSWDVAFAFRPLDVVQQERRLAFHPFALEGIPQLAWEWLDDRWDVTVLWANPLQGQAAVPRHDESGAARVFGRLGPADLHLVLRWSERTGAQAGAGLTAVVGEAVEVHGSVRWQERSAHLAGPARGPGGSPISEEPPGPPTIRHDQVAAVAGFTLTPGLGLSFLGEGWIDPGGDQPATWRARRQLAEAQRALGASGLVPPAAVAGNLAWGLEAFDRQDLLRVNALLRVSGTWGRWEPAVDLVVTPEDRGWVVTAAAAHQGERLRFEGGLRIMGGPPGAAYRLFPGYAAYYLAAQLSL
jgi:hypothetical protein